MAHFKFAPLGGCPAPGTKPNSLQMDLTDIETLHVLDVLINCKKAVRRTYIAELKELGLTF